MITSKTVEFSGKGGITLVADEWSPENPDSQTILMLHGGGQNRHSWKKTGQVLGDQGFHVVAVDTRGHGDSDRSPNADYAVETLAADVHALIEVVGPPVVIIGASMGPHRHPGRQRGRTGAGHQIGVGRRRPRFEKTGSARIRDFMFNHVHGFDSSRRPPRPSPNICRTAPNRVAPRA